MKKYYKTLTSQRQSPLPSKSNADETSSCCTYCLKKVGFIALILVFQTSLLGCDQAEVHEKKESEGEERLQEPGTWEQIAGGLSYGYGKASDFVSNNLTSNKIRKIVKGENSERLDKLLEDLKIGWCTGYRERIEGYAEEFPNIVTEDYKKRLESVDCDKVLDLTVVTPIQIKRELLYELSGFLPSEQETQEKGREKDEDSSEKEEAQAGSNGSENKGGSS